MPTGYEPVEVLLLQPAIVKMHYTVETRLCNTFDSRRSLSVHEKNHNIFCGFFHALNNFKLIEYRFV